MPQTFLKVGDQAPNFKLLSDEGKELCLTDFKGQRVLIYFYPRAGTPGCTVEACEFRDVQPKFKAKEIPVLGVSADPVRALVNFKRKERLNFPLLSDPEHQTIQAFGAWQLKKFMGRTYMGIVRSTFLVGPDGKIEKVWGKVRTKGHATEVLKYL